MPAIPCRISDNHPSMSGWNHLVAVALLGDIVTHYQRAIRWRTLAHLTFLPQILTHLSLEAV